MARVIKTQRRGKGQGRWTAPSHRYKTEAKYRHAEGTGVVQGFDKDPSKTGIVMTVKWDDGKKTMYLAPEGIRKNNCITQGNKAELALGSVMPLEKIPEGIPIFNIENTPGDGGKAVRSSGSSAFISSKTADKILIKLPSKRIKAFPKNCLATIGVVAGGGRTEKPITKAGKAYHKAKARARRWPVVRGVAMNANCHPHGGSQHHTGKPTTVSRDTPPGRKVGHIAASRTGRKKRK